VTGLADLKHAGRHRTVPHMARIDQLLEVMHANPSDVRRAKPYQVRHCLVTRDRSAQWGPVGLPRAERLNVS